MIQKEKLRPEGVNDFSKVGGSVGKESACKCGRPGLHARVGKILWRRAWQPTLRIPTASGAWQAAVHWVAESGTTERPSA